VLPSVLHRWDIADVFDCRDVRASVILVLREFVGCDASPGEGVILERGTKTGVGHGVET
jgi:hypothetical protein